MLLEVKGLTKSFRDAGGFWGGAARGAVQALVEVDLELREGESLGLVGESGCGKSTLARCILQLLHPDRGTIQFQGTDLARLSRHDLRRRRKDFQMIFQDPYASLNPRLSVESMLTEVFRVHGLGTGRDRQERAAALLTSVGLRPEMMRRYPHEFSGGQRQRLGIARALATEPRLVVADEPVSALDVSVQAQILNLLYDLRSERGLSYLFISHDLRVVEQISDRIVVMYLGRIVEVGKTQAVIHHPAHPYTQALLSAVPDLKNPEAGRQRQILRGDIPSPRNPPSGCAFHPRCPIAEARCTTERPQLEVKKSGQSVACHLVA